MRGLSVLVLLVLVLPTLQPDPSSLPAGPSLATGATVPTATASSSAASGSILITEVCPGRPAEYLMLINQGPEVPLRGLIVSDGEGNVTITANRSLASGEALGITTNGSIFSTLHPGVGYFEEGADGSTWGGRFILADTGDEVLVFDPNGPLLDAVAYGSSLYRSDGWSGPPVAPVPKSHALVRTGGDTNSSADWNVEPPGRSSFDEVTFEAVVEPFSVPENAAGRLLREISLATRNINCSVYELSDGTIVSALVDRSRAGVQVRVLIEGQPVGGLSNASLSAIATLQAARVEVRELRSSDSYKRYDYLHAKYMVLDDRRVVVMSENWGSGLHGNRGWGACLDGPGVGAYYGRIFAADLGGAFDVLVPAGTAPLMADEEWSVGELSGLVRFRCPVTTLVSPDFSSATLHAMIGSATTSVLVEEMSVDKEWLTGPSLVGDLVSAAARGVRVRMLLDTSFGGGDNPEVARYLNALACANGLDLEVRMISPYHGLEVMHNKGMIVDDRVAVSSINWGNSALFENREVGVVLSSPQASAYYSTLFWQDWAEDPIPPQARLPWAYLTVRSGLPVLLDGGNSSDNGGLLTYTWYHNGAEAPVCCTASWIATLPVGNNSIVLTVTDRGNNTANATCWVEVLPDRAPEQVGPVVLLVPIVVAAGVMVWKRIIRRKRY